MENTFYKKAKLATAIALVSSTTLLTGCLIEGNESKSITSAAIGDNAVSTTAPKGSIQGIVQDTNGNPIQNATVYIGNRSVRTNAGGTYQLDNVAVTGIEVTNDNDYLGGSIRVVIVPPEGYLGAVVDVDPSAVVDHGRSDQGTTEETGTGNTNRFVDGFTAVAGDAVLPAIGSGGATITGVLRDNVTHEAVANQTVNLELKSVNGGNHTTGTNAISYTTLSYRVTTDAEGNFTITGAPNDSDLTFVVGGYNVNSVDANVFNTTGVITDDEVERIHVGNVYVTEIPNDDTASPFVVAIEEAALNGARAKLNDDVTDVLTVHFSEPVQTGMVDDNSVVVRDVTAGEYLTVAVAFAADGRSMTLTNSADFVAGNEIDIYLLKVDFRDAAHNMLDEDSDVLTTGAISYDYDDVNGNSDFLKLQVEVFRNLLQDATVVSVINQLTTDDTAARSFAGAEAESSSFADVNITAVDDLDSEDIEQLNSAEDQDKNGTVDTAERLAQRIAALELAGLIDGTNFVQLNDNGEPDTSAIALADGLNTSMARVQFTPTNAASYRYWIMDGASAVSTDIVIDVLSSPDAEADATNAAFTPGGANTGYGIIKPKASSAFADFVAAPVTFLVDGVKPGQQIFIQSMDEFGNEGSFTSITLADNVPATTALQWSGNQQDLTSTSTVFGTQYGNGGELANPDAAEVVGVPLLNVNALLLADQSENPDATPSYDSLFAANEKDANEDAYITTPNVYDATAYNIWKDTLTRTVGIGFTEDIAWTGPDATDSRKPAAAGDQPVVTGMTAGLSDWTITNDVLATHAADATSSDIVSVVIDDILTLANTDGQAWQPTTGTPAVIDFTDKLVDAAGVPTTAAAKAQVVINDALPPLVVKAEWTGDSLTVTFNEPVMLDSSANTTVVLTLGGQNISLDADTKALHNAKSLATRNVLVIDHSDIADFQRAPIANVGGLFNLGQYAETDSGVSLSSSGIDAQGHATLAFENVQDIAGNSWAQDSNYLDESGAAIPFTTPIATAFDSVGEFSSTTSGGAFVQGAGTTSEFTVTYTFTHRVDWSAHLAALGEDPTSLTAAQVGTLFTYTGAAIDTTNGSNTAGVIDQNGKRLILTIDLGAEFIATGDIFTFSNTTLQSEWTTESTTVTAITATP